MGEKFYLTKKGYENLKKELEKLKKLKIAQMTGEKGNIPNVFESDDVNCEFLVFQENLDFLESRISDLEYILKNAEIIKPPPKSKWNEVHLGAIVTVEVEGQIDEFQIVGTLEANPSLGKISNESPVGKALLGHKVGEEVTISSPIKTTYKIKKIRYNLS